MTFEQVKQDLKGWWKKLRSYQKADAKKAVIQIINTFWPYVGLLVGMFFAYSYLWLWSRFLAIPAWLFLLRIFVIQHDCWHNSFFPRKKWNQIVWRICSFLTTIPYVYRAKVHNHHHVHNGILEHRWIWDIYYITVEEYMKLSPWRKFVYRVFRTPVLQFIVSPIIYFIFSNRVPLFILKFKERRKEAWLQIVNNLGLAIFFLLLGIFLWWELVLGVYLPVLFVFFVGAFRLFFIQHQHEENFKKLHKQRDFLLSAIKWSTYYKLPNMWMRLTWWIGLHHLHHLNASIPNYNLAKCARENPEFQKHVTKLTFWESLSLIRNALWDETTQRMISFREYRRRYVTAN